jgi:2-polyprenyl-3-methyl-5-hydroxy-6-metoxy-1,4-benzoquinol methylase
MTIDGLREIIARLGASAGALAAIAAALDARIEEEPLEPSLGPHVDELVRAVGARELIDGPSGAELKPLLAEIRFYMAQNAKIAFRHSRIPGWAHEEAHVLQSAGDVSAAFPHVLKRMIVPNLVGLEARMDAAGAAFLDVGTGVGSLAIQMARVWPSLRVVGVDVWRPSIELARANIAREGLTGRIEVREQSGVDLPDISAFDLAWIPSLFIPEAALRAIVDRVLVALRPGGWLLFPSAKAPVDPIAGPLMRLRIAHFGGPVLSSDEMEGMLKSAGYAEVRALPTPPQSPMSMVVGRRSA